MRNPILASLIAALLACSCEHHRVSEPPTLSGPADGGGYVVSTKQLIRPAGQSVEFRGRPVDLALSPDGKTIYAKSNAQLLAIERTAMDPPVHLAPNQAGTLEDLQMLGHCRQRHRERRRELADGRGSLCQPRDHLASRPIRQRAEQVIEPIFG